MCNNQPWPRGGPMSIGNPWSHVLGKSHLCSPHHDPRFRKPPCDPGRSDFPSPVLASALHAICQTLVFPRQPGDQAPTRILPDSSRFTSVLVSVPRAHDPAQCLGVSRLRETTECPEPLCPAGPTLCRGDLVGRLGGRYPSVVAHTGSCARPPFSPGLRLSRRARGPCRLSLVPAA